MRTCASWILAGLLAALFGLAAGARDTPGDPRQGRVLAVTVCAACHAIEKGAPIAEPGTAPSFQSVAANPAMTVLALRVFLRTPHDKMPDLILTEAETDDIIAYILSLADRR